MNRVRRAHPFVGRIVMRRMHTLCAALPFFSGTQISHAAHYNAPYADSIVGNHWFPSERQASHEIPFSKQKNATEGKFRGDNNTKGDTTRI